jgi:hypothetical protein
MLSCSSRNIFINNEKWKYFIPFRDGSQKGGVICQSKISPKPKNAPRLHGMIQSQWR